MIKESDIATKSLNTIRTQTHMTFFGVQGLRPNTRHDVYLEGELYTFACKQFGKDLGEDLISDENGRLAFYMLHEVEFNRNMNFELQSSQSLAFQSSGVNQQDSRREANLVTNYKIVEIKSPDGNSYSQLNLESPLLLTPGTVRTLYPIE